MAYYPDWAGDAFPPEKIDFSRFDWIDFAFAVPDAQFNLTWDGSDDAPELLRRLVSRAHAAGKKVKLSVGGWTGSRYFSAAAASAEGRATLANNIHALYSQFGLDGIDLDWEYPAQAGNAGNLVSAVDSANFLEFLKVLRATLPPQARITAATQTVPFADANGDPMQDASEFAKVLDWVLLMNYDTWGSSSTPGPNAPLSDACHNSTQGSASALAALRTWTAAGFPASQLVLGVPSYGYLSRSSASFLRARGPAPPPRFARTRPRPRRRLHTRVLDWVGALVDKTAALPIGQTLVVNEDGGTDNGQVQFRDLVRQGIVLVQPYPNTPKSNASSRPADADAPPQTPLSGDPPAPGPTPAAPSSAARALFAGAGGFERRWDACSGTPFLRSAGARQVVAYDDPESIEMKAQLVRGAGMRGVNMFDVSGDTDGWDLTDAMWRGVGGRL
ncbi:glycoside hydrolase [Trametes meyenii]|nr:glycoside hydrolase [Trametes meyenii]